jgi:hypothetical protein
MALLAADQLATKEEDMEEVFIIFLILIGVAIFAALFTFHFSRA